MRIFICSPFRSDDPVVLSENIETARRLCRIAALKGHVPIAPHLYFPQFLKDDKPSERTTGINMGLLLLQDCDEVWFTPLLSDGMKRELSLAEDLGKLFRVVIPLKGEERFSYFGVAEMDTEETLRVYRRDTFGKEAADE